MQMRAAQLALWVLSAAPLLAPIAPYPQAPALPAPGSVLPSFVDDDERVLAKLAPDGHVVSMRSDVLLQLAGRGDFVVIMPGPVLDVVDLGGDATPSLQDGHVTFQGHVEGKKLLAAEAGLDVGRYSSTLPLRLDIKYFAGNREIDPRSAAGSAGDFRESIAIHNFTGQNQAFLRGQPEPAALTRVLEALKGVPGIYTPETDLGALYPLPATIPVTAGAGAMSIEQPVFVPLAIDVTAQLDPGANVGEARGATVTRDERGTRLRWRVLLPADTTSGADASLEVTFHSDRLRMPGLDFNVQVQPLPSAVFTPPGGGAWDQYIAAADPTTLEQLSLKAQSGSASLHRVQDAPPPINRPGSGPEKVSYNLVLDSGVVAAAPPPPALPAPQPWAIALVAVGALVVGANAWWAWSRN